ncbi:MAG: hypothetical protein KDA52_21530 [Planctomycetaceae bacterium]|nr:hypothetical protein [Planctomycetaceae bacterium]
MESLVCSLLADPFGVSKENYRVLMDILEDECGEERAEEVDRKVESVTIHTMTRFRFAVEEDTQ